jgi:hypothetical protein
VTLALILAVASALATSVAFLLKQRGAVLAPVVRVRHPLRSAAALFRSRWFALGWVVAVGAWGLHVGALALAPLSVVQAVLAAGLVFLAVLASHHGALRARQGLFLGAASGALFGVSDIALKFLTHAVGGGVLELISPWTFAAVAASVVAFYTSARGLQIGPGVEVIALTAVAANLTAILGGILVFRDSIGAGAVGITGRMIAFGLVIAGAALIPAPLRAANRPTVE